MTNLESYMIESMVQSEIINDQFGIINGPDHDQAEIIKFLFQTRVDVTCNLNKKFQILRTASFIG